MKTQNTVPRHLAIIMDGNGRWAELRRHDRTFGHLRGAKIAKNIIEECSKRGVAQLTLYAFSTENWMRPKSEVSFLMKLLGRHMARERRTLIQNNIRFSVIGDVSRIPAPVLAEVNRTIAETKTNTGMSLTFALSYGGRQEVADAARAIAKEVAAGRLDPNSIDEQLFSRYLQSSNTLELPEPDLIIRTSGEYRLSNFMLWQAAYSELYVTETLWPDFNAGELDHAFMKFAARERRFGRTNRQVADQVSLVNLLEMAVSSARRVSV